MDNQDQTLDAGLQSGDDNASGLTITQNIREYWHESTRWGLFFAVLGFLYIGLLVLGILGLGISGARSLIGGLFSLFIAGGIVFAFTWFMFQFSQHVKKALDTENVASANYGFRSLRRLYQLSGILMIIILSFYVLIFLFGLIVGISR